MKNDAIQNMKRQMGWTYKVYVLTFPDGKKYEELCAQRPVDDFEEGGSDVE